MAAMPGSSSENETRFDRALNLINRADFFAAFLNDVKKIFVTIRDGLKNTKVIGCAAFE